MAACVLIADDDRAIRTVLTQALGRRGHEVRTTDSASTLWQWVARGDGDLVITDVRMPDGNGLDLVPQIRKLRPALRVIVMSAQNTLMTAVRAAEGGAFEYLPKPFDLTELLNVVDRALTTAKQAVAEGPPDFEEEGLPLIGRSSVMQEIYRVLARLMGTDLTVLIYGESGTGKELVAQALHDYGRRRNGRFVAINMAAIPRDLIESELFGHEKGAFTGAANRSSGLFEQAQGGTLFLDEIGDMPLEAQTRLLRVLQEGEYSTVGGRVTIKTDARIVAATHRDLRQMVRQGLFREDLFYRLSVVPLRLPALRERLGDVPELARHFMAQLQEEGLTSKVLDESAIAALTRHDWPGNVRELRNLVQRLSVLSRDEVINKENVEQEIGRDQPAESRGTPSVGESLGEAVERHLRHYFAAHGTQLPAAGLHERVIAEIERPLIELSLEATDGNQIRAAEVLGINRNTLRKKIRELGVSVTRGSRPQP